MDEEQRKRTRRATLDQLEEERSSPALEIIGSETEEADDGTTTSASDEEDFDCTDDEEDDDFLYGGLDVSDDDCDEYFSQEMEEDDVDPDELSYEELLALGDMVGVENTGLSETEISKHMHPLTCHSTTALPIDRCVICQVEYEQGEELIKKEGEELVSLHCDHIYHKDCISKWLQIKKICPICNNEVSSVETPKTPKSG